MKQISAFTIKTTLKSARAAVRNPDIFKLRIADLEASLLEHGEYIPATARRLYETLLTEYESMIATVDRLIQEEKEK